METSPVQKGTQQLLEFREATAVFQNYLAANGAVEQAQEASRRLRGCKVDVERMKSSGEVNPGQTYIGVRLISQNIKNALPPLLSYLKNSPRMATFSPGDNQYLDSEFTRVLQWPGWEVPYIQTLDSAEQNGLGYMKVSHDESKLGHVSFDNVAFCDVVYDRRLKNIQDSPALLVKHTITRVSFYHWDTFENFDKASPAYAAIVQQLETPQTTQDIAIYEAFLKIEGFVYRGWYYNSGTDWLKKPEPFSNGVMINTPQLPATSEDSDPTMIAEPVMVPGPSNRTEYPIIVKRFEITSEPKHELAEGRAQNDYHKQEAASLMMSAMINGALQASNTMWSPEGGNIDGGAPAQTNMKIKNGQVWKTPMRAFNAPYPDPMLSRAIEQIVTQNAAETNQVAFAVNNRKDTRKTAKELDVAQEQQQQLTSADALVFSIFLRELFTQAWPIVKSAAMFGKIDFLSQDGQKDITLNKNYEIKPAGDIDFIEKQKRLTDIQQDLPMFQGTPLGSEMTKEYIRLRYPEKYEAWSKLLAQQDQAKQLIQGLGAALQETVTAPDGQLKPEFAAEAQNLQTLQQNVQQFLQPPQQK
jgi:hypothetical protein